MFFTVVLLFHKEVIMKKVIKFWDMVLVAMLGLIGSSCVLEPPPAEYGPQPEYGVPYSVQTSDDLQEIND